MYLTGRKATNWSMHAVPDARSRSENRDNGLKGSLSKYHDSFTYVSFYPLCRTLVSKQRVIMLFPGYLPTFPASIMEPLLNMHTASYMSLTIY